MDKKSVSASLLVMYLALVFSVIGICFAVFVYQANKILITKVAVSYSENLKVYEDEKLTKEVSELKLSNMDTGLKPATGEIDKETQIPSTVTDEGTSEGYYSTVYVKSGVSFKIIVKDINIETKKDEIAVKEERKNIFIAIKDVENATKSIEEDEIELAKFENVTETQKLTFMIWIGSLAGDELEGAKISFKLDFVAV